MPTFVNANRQVFTLPGLRHQALAGASDSLAGREVWSQSLDPGAARPPHYHECEEVVVIQSGRGQLIIDGEASAFGPGTTLIVAARVVHQIVNTGESEMTLLAALSETPARVFMPDGALLALPWHAGSAESNTAPAR
jgi:mannose-6-phosphate isomerase-like protein (cupin superfamily)